MASFNYNNKTVLITGGGSGIGEALSKQFAINGADVHILDFQWERAQHVVEEITNLGHKAQAHLCDVSNHGQVKKVIDNIAAYHSLDVLINNAGIAHVGNIEGTSESDLDRLYEVNIKGVYNCMYAVIGKMKERGSGVILNMASIAASVGIPERFAYSMTKGAVLTMTYSVAKDYVGYGIRCNSISPARVHTPFVDGFISKNYPGKEQEMFEKLSKTQPIGRMGKPEEVANLALYLCSDEASFITGTDFPIDGGFIKLNA
ncbi:NAD(P)-dependent dehydrogenase, short-chain alcohol dehydrogenase family [Flagellimonas taeanensis]|uniref:NAD(P)-dependent dehydrogenase, short-chain alcohol dehydrogenase family n=1 Tax=Flagellimonas taeanensis TaxID=1005926 RepID=A0A1M6WC25_9FLAO|nr:SDR family oxidoreductase [Allomuricauda taeanensis]SFC44612.1 NAD(P)-dependent dehydrogenase, short-chain alcohol dehydrogenase family [Allomuricauda taeanensis]SHK91209.1 NAD(P)-dependent dehydrogenase, short-chain alcohol dehydrogenase family [Allomuricauda taeanensis]